MPLMSISPRADEKFSTQNPAVSATRSVSRCRAVETSAMAKHTAKTKTGVSRPTCRRNRAMPNPKTSPMRTEPPSSRARVRPSGGPEPSPNTSLATVSAVAKSTMTHTSLRMVTPSTVRVTGPSDPVSAMTAMVTVGELATATAPKTMAITAALTRSSEARNGKY
jgi:hypothetical protein